MATETMRRTCQLALLAATLVSTSCVGSGAIYTNVTRPLTTTFEKAQVVEGSAEGNTKQFRYQVDFNWDSRAIGDIAKKAGLTEIFYADETVLSVLGVWTQRFVTVYGR